MDAKMMKKIAMKKAIEILKKDMKDDMFMGLKPKTSVTVAGDSPEAVKEGLEKAEKVLDKKDMFKEAFLASKRDSLPDLEDMEEESEEECPMCEGVGCKMCGGGMASKS
jgi:hypothetical protein